MAQKLIVEIAGDTSKLEGAFRSAGATADGFGSKLGGVAKTAGLLAGGAALGGIALVLKTGIGEWSQSAKVAAQTDAVLKSTGKSAGVSAKQVSDLAGALLKKSGVDDEAIQSGENLLLTFTNIRNEAGKGNDIFNQTTKTMLDMSVALGQDTKSSAIQLGKALNDPIKGVTALQRVGVSFTAAQKDQIKAMVDSGHAMSAQKLILGELNKEFGGSAEAAGKTLPGQLSILKESFNNVAGQIVGSMMPAFTGMATWVTTSGLPLMQNLGDKLSGVLQPAFRGIGNFISTSVTPIMRELWQVFKADLLPIINQLRDVFTTAIQKIGAIVKAHMPEIHTIFTNLGTVMKNIGTIVMPLLKFAFETVLPTALRVAIPVIEIVTGALKTVTTVLKDVFQWGGKVAGFFSDLPSKISGAFKGLGSTLGAVLKEPINAVIGMLDAFRIPGFHVDIPLVGSVGFDGFTPFHIPYLAVGTNQVFSDGVAYLHRGEQVVPASVAGGGYSGGAPSGDLVLVIDGQVFGRIARRELSRTGRLNATIFGSTAIAGGITA